MPVYTKDGGMRFTAGDFAPGSAQRAIADGQARAMGAVVVPVAAAPTLQDILNGDTPYCRRYREIIENAWRDPPPQPGDFR